MKLFIPEIGTKLELLTDWPFELHDESRNEALIQASGESHLFLYDWRSQKSKESPSMYGWRKDNYEDCTSEWHKTFTLPSCSILTVDRIYIRRGLSGFSSVSFFVDRKTVDPVASRFAYNINSGKGKCRFWAKLDDVNKMQCSIYLPPSVD